MVKWYPFLNKKGTHNLFDNEKISNDNLVVSQQIDKTRKYAKFRDYLEFRTYRERITPDEDCFFEIVSQKNFRKPYFDIDMENSQIDEKDFIDNITQAILGLIKDAVILIYSSHTGEKFSFHIVVNNYYFVNHDEARNFYQETIKSIKEEYLSYMDESVYKSVQQFRILGSHKYGKDNKKIFREDLSVNYVVPKRYERFPQGLKNYQLLISLIGNVAGAKYLSGYEKKEEPNRILSKGFSSTSDLEDILNIFHSTYSADIFEYLNTIDNDGNLLITFRRLSSSYCEECQRVHENENPFITVNGIYRNIYYYCRRRDGDEDKRGKLIGSLGPEIIPDLKIEDIPIIPQQEDEMVEGGMSIIDEMKNLNFKKKKPKPVILTDFLKL